MSDLTLAAKLASIRVLYRQPDTLTLWGLPYRLRPGQSPRDLWEARTPERQTYVPGSYAPRRPGPREDWVYLGEPGWFSTYSAPEIEAIKRFLALLGDLVPGGPCEWAELPDEHWADRHARAQLAVQGFGGMTLIQAAGQATEAMSADDLEGQR